MFIVERDHRTNPYVGALQITVDMYDFVYKILFFTVRMYVHILVSVSLSVST